jgi:hypothetical protein
VNRPLATAVLVAALVVCPAAAAHGGGGGALGFRSHVKTVTPATTGLKLTVLDYDDRLQLTNDTGKTVIVLGYENEPYLMFKDGRVYRNARSPATYLNDDRYGQVQLPPQASAKAPPEWKELVDHPEYDWHDHRIHWMSRTLPPKVQAHKNLAQRVFDWAVPITVDGRRTMIHGSLDYTPPPGGKFPFLLVLPPVLIFCAAAILWTIRRSRSASDDSPPPAGRRAASPRD